MLARYTPFEARVLEDHYIACAKAEGIWGKGKPPADKRMVPNAVTYQGLARQKKSKERKAKVLKAVRNGYCTASAIGNHLQLSDTCVRRYLRELGELGFIKQEGKCPLGGITWQAVDSRQYDA